MPKTAIRSLVFLLALTCLPALADDGQTPIPFVDPYATPHFISQPGSYIVTRDLTPTGPGPILEISCVDMGLAAVTIDLNGFNLDNTADPNSPVIRIVGAPQCEVIVRNGELLGGSFGIEVLPPMRKVVAEDLEIKESAQDGIYLFDTEKFVLRRNVIRNLEGTGIRVDGALPKHGVIEDNQLRQVGDGIAIISAQSFELSNNRIKNVFGGFFGGAGIHLEDVQGCLLSQNLVQELSNPGAPGVRMVFSRGCKLHNNIVNRTSGDGIFLDQESNDHLLLENVVTEAATDGLYVDGKRNHIDRNLLNFNGAGGTGHGLHLGPGAFDNNYGRNTAVGNPGGPCLAPQWSPDLCQDNGPLPGPPNWSFGDNLMPGGFGSI